MDDSDKTAYEELRDWWDNTDTTLRVFHSEYIDRTMETGEPVLTFAEYLLAVCYITEKDHFKGPPTFEQAAKWDEAALLAIYDCYKYNTSKRGDHVLPYKDWAEERMDRDLSQYPRHQEGCQTE